MLEAAALKLLNESNEIRIIANILDVIHLLPPAASMFTSEMVKIVINLENTVRRYQSCPFRDPLVKFLNRFHSQASEYFVMNMNDAKIGRLLVDCLRHPNAVDLRKQIMNDIDRFLNVCLFSTDAIATASNNFMRLVKELCTIQREWILTKPDLVEKLATYWGMERDAMMDEASDLPLAHLYRWKHLAYIFVCFCSQNHDHPGYIFNLVDIFMRRNVVDFSFVKEFFINVVGNEYTVEKKRLLVREFLDMIMRYDTGITKKILTLRVLIIPLLMQTFKAQEGQELLDPELLNVIHSRIWSSDMKSGDSFQLDSQLKLEFIQLTSLLISNIPQTLSEHRKDIIKFAWQYLKYDDIITRYAAL